MSPFLSYNDQELLAQMTQNNHKAFEELWNRYWELAFNVAYKRLKDEDQCQDLVQDLFIDLWDRRAKLFIDNFPAYLNSAIRYKVYKVLSRKNTDAPYYEAFDELVATAMGADNAVVEKELQDLATAWLNTLPAKRKEIFLLYFRENLSTKEIADRLNISQKTVQNQIGTSSKELRKKLLTAISIMPGI
ncbi:RNA polymerase sigma factor [Pseudobacter ginsenosidimutans]|uniref:RNA polymerase sigma-70 factor (ECF subfamily) n=1 Tax=Pseudobacter ginsenosidimutans TaxID=661488 RepID=A0A4V2F1Z3_9BACT|nr:sigma-70 family RNA polymerase sigma factor [Pseudobacter ginsenosidimutans]QEC44036.1 sigma-70 family RNA polymerase sigma factor [Pseudobacter ginsenosidimutans]RZS75476.1 RNA polymerase sigma-70 factor (ECF subfamily) [Pseudobacter ginsenosidimutans]